MERKKFLKEGLLGLGAIVALPTVFDACKKKDDTNGGGNTNGCSVSPSETAGPFPILTPTQLVRNSIIGDRTGIALLMNITVNDQSNGCTPLAGVLVDVWHCDKAGNYSQYGTNASNTFLRGRQTTNANGQVSFISIFPGWYPGRAPHIHVEVLNANGQSILVSQIAFPVNVYSAVYATSGYNGTPDTSNTSDGIFNNSLSGNLADNVVGDIVNGYTLTKTIVVP